MENHIANVLDLPRLAQLTELSERQLNRLFRENRNIAAMELYRNLRQNRKDFRNTTTAIVTGIRDAIKMPADHL